MTRPAVLTRTAAIAFLGCIIIRSAHAQHGLPDNYVFDEINVILAPGVSIDSINARYGTTLREQIPGTSYYRLGTPGGADGFDVEGGMAGDTDLASTDL